MRIKKGDTVEILKTFASGERQWTRGQRGKVLKVDPAAEQVIVEGVRMMFRHMRRSQENPRGARIEKEGPIHISNVAIVCPSCVEKSRVGYRRLDSGKKVRFCKKCDQNIDVD